MKKFNKTLGRVLAVAILASSLSGCLYKRFIRDIDDHSTIPATLVKTMDIRYYVLWMKYTNQFWECNDKGQAVECKQACGADDNSAECITVSVFTPIIPLTVPDELLIR